MRHTLPFRALPLALAGLLASCGDGITPPPSADEAVPVTVSHRLRVPGERTPWIEVTGGSGTIRFRVVRVAFCATIVDAKVRRTPGGLDVVARVAHNPAADCFGLTDQNLVDFEGVVSAVPTGTYLVRVFEGVGDGVPRLIGTDGTVVR
jgi:hypothetical protein